jgi:hypothetical protein
VKPERDANNRVSYRNTWWIFGEPRKDFRPALAELPRYISTIETAKHRFFVFLPAEVLPDNRLVNIASSDAFHLSVLSSHIHVCWALQTGGTLEDRPIYTKSICFDAFPFPTATPEQQTRIRDLGEKLDVHRKARQALHPDLTMTGMYNVLEALRAGRALTDKEKIIHENGLVSVLRELHDELDAAVADAYGWPVNLPDEEILARLVALNAQRVHEEKQGIIRWLRADYQTQSKEERRAAQGALDFAPPPEPTSKGKKTKLAKAKPAAKTAWPANLLAQTQAVRNTIAALRESNTVVTPDAIATHFSRAPRERVEEILRALNTLGLT